jgi:diguanylate cyclase (GGDEF)-like protein
MADLARSALFGSVNGAAHPFVERRTRIPGLDQVAMICLLLTSDGRIRWSNSAAAGLGRALARIPDTLADLFDPADRILLSDVVRDAHVHGRAQVTVRVIRMTIHEGPRYFELVLTRAGARRPRAGDDAGGGVIGGLLVQGWDVTSMMLRVHDLEGRASRDLLTGLANRLTFSERLGEQITRSQGTGRSTAVLFIDIDDFTLVNDTHGHSTGDLVLIALGQRLNGALRPEDTLARVGGHGFAIICPDLLDHDHARAIVAQVRVAAMGTTGIDERWMRFSLSIGLAFAVDGDGDDGGTGLLIRAGQARYQQKYAKGRRS